MKKMNLLSFGAFFLLSACGARTPLRRGPDVSIQMPTAFQIPGNKPEDLSGTPTDVDKTYYETVLYPLFQKRCTVCHDDKFGPFESAKKSIVFKKPEESKMYLTATGKAFSHRQIFKPDSAEAITIATWINGGRVTQ